MCAEQVSSALGEDEVISMQSDGTGTKRPKALTFILRVIRPPVMASHGLRARCAGVQVGQFVQTPATTVGHADFNWIRITQ